MQPYHTLVTGDSGGGKTTLMRQMHDEFPGLSVFVDASDRGIDGISGRDLDDAATVHSLTEARRSSATRLRFRADTLDDVLDDARQLALDYSDRTGYPSQVIVDEIQRVAASELDGTHPVKRMLHEDRDAGLKAVIATQDPSDLQPNYSMLKQLRYFIWVGGWSNWHKGFIGYWDIPKSDLPEDPYEYVVFDKRFDVLHRDETEVAYA